MSINIDRYKVGQGSSSPYFPCFYLTLYFTHKEYFVTLGVLRSYMPEVRADKHNKEAVQSSLPGIGGLIAFTLHNYMKSIHDGV